MARALKNSPADSTGLCHDTTGSVQSERPPFSESMRSGSDLYPAREPSSSQLTDVKKKGQELKRHSMITPLARSVNPDCFEACVRVGSLRCFSSPQDHTQARSLVNFCFIERRRSSPACCRQYAAHHTCWKISEVSYVARTAAVQLHAVIVGAVMWRCEGFQHKSTTKLQRFNRNGAT